MGLSELLSKLDYQRVSQEKDLFDVLNFILTNHIAHKCYNKECKEIIYFSNAFKQFMKEDSLSLKDFVKIWSAPHNLKKFSDWDINVPFYCCKCFRKEKLKKL